MDKGVETRFEIAFSDEQAMLLESAVALVQDKSSSRRARELAESASGYDEAAWREMAELGWTGVAIPEQYGGAGLDIADATPILEALGSGLMASPLLGTLLASRAIAGSGDEAAMAKWLPKLAGGAVGALALAEDENAWEWSTPACKARREGDVVALQGVKRSVAFAAAADVVVASVTVEGRPRFVAIPREALEGRIRPETTTDVTQRTSTVDLDGLKVAASDLLPDVDVEAVARAATLLQAAEMCGGVASAIEYTLDYLKTRKAFGRLIGSYQGLKHVMADAYVQYELLRSLVYSAATSLHGEDGEFLVRMAKTKANELFVHVGDRAVQFHGGFGFTYDCDAGFYLRRAIWSQSQYGNAQHHRKRLASLLLDA